ncbi:MAG: hypothetical protein UW24_C0003G0017 [Parcubacteria group bacterium GW2011_GWA2_44_12]|nr:MAG: hypothetical protein UW24_C0003G0017 [Parcubacteria group bacterium GW2011_GWA2_44_12]
MFKTLNTTLCMKIVNIAFPKITHTIKICSPALYKKQAL